MFKTIFLKEMKDVLRDKRSITLLIIFPILMMAGLTFFYDKILTSSEEEDFTMAVGEEVDSELISQLEKYMPTLTIEKFQDVQKAVEEKKVQIGIKLDEDWKQRLENQEAIPVNVIFDPGSQDSSTASNIAMAGLNQWQQEAVQLRLAGQNIDSSVLEVFQIETKTTKDEDNAIASFMLGILIPLLIPMAIANGSYPSATELFAGEKEKKTIEALLITPIKPIKILLAKWMTISLLGIFTGVLCIALLSIFVNFTTELKKGLAVIANPVPFVLMSIVLIVLFAIFFAEVEMILSMMANSVKEAGHYMTPVIGMITLPMLFMFFAGEALSLPLYAVPLMNLFLFVRDAFSGQLTIGAFGLAAGSYALLIIILFPIAAKLFGNHRLMLGK
ncbi:ABC transporter permease [Lederbergia wuyishanensis]|uniref:Sodium transport system permease protein n=1 Tax=Lederbergia wuyishanensis TaxID=1347903 RepID=A0ABU0D5E7_9BACI|nr:ABC transporter permease [Lederbergia wuyishanensis]MCJ8009782.1 ABC transporter permease [Lederbergia wuyishanensis]MDQ0343638.1 sodium transport system permease protein [Lederbergia wuyishanensis]